LRGHSETIGERFERDRAALLPLPAAPYEACETVAARVSSLALLVRGYVHEGDDRLRERSHRTPSTQL